MPVGFGSWSALATWPWIYRTIDLTSSKSHSSPCFLCHGVRSRAPCTCVPSLEVVKATDVTCQASRRFHALRVQHWSILLLTVTSLLVSSSRCCCHSSRPWLPAKRFEAASTTSERRLEAALTFSSYSLLSSVHLEPISRSDSSVEKLLCLFRHGVQQSLWKSYGWRRKGGQHRSLDKSALGTRVLPGPAAMKLASEVSANNCFFLVC